MHNVNQNTNGDMIKKYLSMYDVLDRCGLYLNRHNSMCCPLHREKTPSFKVYKDGSRFKCFGCGIGGDVITFVMRYYSLSYGQAIIRLASEFNIQIAGAKPLTVQDRIRANEERRARKQETEEREREYDRLFDAYSSACDEFIRLEGNLTMYKPKTVTEPFNELYCEALHKLPYQRYKCDMLQIALENLKERGCKS